jgi:hypothetical protein
MQLGEWIIVLSRSRLRSHYVLQEIFYLIKNYRYNNKIYCEIVPDIVHITEECKSRNFARIIIIELCELMTDILIPITSA